METTLAAVNCKLFQIMPYIIILKARKFHQACANRFSTAKKKPVGGAQCAPPPPSLNRVKFDSLLICFTFVVKSPGFSQDKISSATRVSGIWLRVAPSVSIQAKVGLQVAYLHIAMRGATVDQDGIDKPILD